MPDALTSWYTTIALEKMKEIDKGEYLRLRCRVNYHALRFKPHIMKPSKSIVDKLPSQGHLMSIHLRFEIVALIYSHMAKKNLEEISGREFCRNRLVYNERKAIGKCLLTLDEVSYLGESRS